MPITSTAPLVLGSGSPRRREILSGLGIPLRVLPADVDETLHDREAPEAYLERVVTMKLGAVARLVQGEMVVPGILVADTIVVVDGEVLGKPSHIEDARRLLLRIVGRSHVVMTRYAISAAPDLVRASAVRTVQTRVTMRAASDAEVERYAATGEGLDKAGAYAAQGIGSFLIEAIEGSFSNVVGLPACEVVQDLVATGLVDFFPRPP